MGLGQDQSIQFISGVGPKLADKLSKLGIRTVSDFLLCFPKSYEDRRQFDSISTVNVGESGLFLLQVHAVSESHPKPKVALLKAILSDRSGSLEGIWFNQSFLKTSLIPGRFVVVRGKMQWDAFSMAKQLVISDCEIFANEAEVRVWTGKILPVYALTPGIFQKKMRQIAKDVLVQWMGQIQDPLPESWRIQLQLPEKRQSIRALHFPASFEEADSARKRMVFDEFLIMQLVLALQRVGQSRESGISLPVQGPLFRRYLDSLAYVLTAAQTRVVDEICADVRSGQVLNRLVQGDVGSGKTDVAVLTLLLAVDGGYQAALMAPTEVLAEQHYLKLQRLLGPLGVSIHFLKGSLSKHQKNKTKDLLKMEEPCIVIGTHALIQESVQFNRLAVAVIDEQHRFGVFQRMTFRAKGVHTHCLYLTATPIPRSLMLTAFGDLDKSIIDELPPGRQPIRTVAIPLGQLDRVLLLCQEELANGGQIFVVYPLIDQSEKLDLQAAISGYEIWATRYFPNANVGLIHGKMAAKEKSRIMMAFKSGDLDILVSTTVIEVGVDVPHATVMVIMHADRFGLAQLHQLRGRIGRGKRASTCVLIHDASSSTAKKRIEALVHSQDGFKLAEVDLSIRGPGDVLGIRQSGMPELNMADIVRDEAELLLARRVAQQIVKIDPTLTRSEFLGLNRMIQEGSGNRVILEGLN